MGKLGAYAEFEPVRRFTAPPPHCPTAPLPHCPIRAIPHPIPVICIISTSLFTPPQALLARVAGAMQPTHNRTGSAGVSFSDAATVMKEKTREGFSKMVKGFQGLGPSGGGGGGGGQQ